MTDEVGNDGTKVQETAEPVASTGAPCCAPGCGCGTPTGKGKTFKIFVCLAVAAAVAGILVAKSMKPEPVAKPGGNCCPPAVVGTISAPCSPSAQCPPSTPSK